MEHQLLSLLGPRRLQWGQCFLLAVPAEGGGAAWLQPWDGHTRYPTSPQLLLLLAAHACRASRQRMHSRDIYINKYIYIYTATGVIPLDCSCLRTGSLSLGAQGV